MTNRPSKQYQRGQTILLEGEPGDCSYRILSGEVVICKQSVDGAQVPIARLREGEMFGEMYLFEQAMSRTASAIAFSAEVTVEVLGRDEMQNWLSQLSPRIQSIVQGMSKRLQKISGKYTHTLTLQKAKKAAAQGPDTSSDTYIHRQPTEL
jgi:CRP/FNR family cyclic AMP-dependent transcriptional regulator